MNGEPVDSNDVYPIKWRLKMDRREFIKDGLRTVILGGFVLFGLFLGLRKPSRTEKSSAMIPQSPCRECRKIKSCSQSNAVRYRKGEEQSDSPSCPEKEGV